MSDDLRAQRSRPTKKPLLGELLKHNGLVSEHQLEEALRRQQGSFKLLGEILIEMGAITRSQLSQMLETQHRLLGTGPQEAKRVLIIEDDIELARALRDGLRLADYRAQIALNGAEAMALLLSSETRPPHLILLDLGLPRFSGLEVLRTLRKNEATADLPVIVLTGHTDPEEEEQARQLGVREYLRKPTALNDILSLVASTLGEETPPA
jgi:CheY-like chemotaxis protein